MPLLRSARQRGPPHHRAQTETGVVAQFREIGDEAFATGLRQHADATRFAVATPTDLRPAFGPVAAPGPGQPARAAGDGRAGG